MTSEAVEAAAADDNSGIGANKRRKKPASKTGVKPVEVVTAVEAAVEVKKSGPDNDAIGCDAEEAIKVFTLDYTDGRGYHWTGAFTNQILTIGQRATVGLTRSRMSGGVPLDTIDDATLTMLEMQAHLAVSLMDAPEWAANLSKIRDLGVLGAIYTEVAAHEATFWGSES